MSKIRVGCENRMGGGILDAAVSAWENLKPSSLRSPPSKIYLMRGGQFLRNWLRRLWAREAGTAAAAAAVLPSGKPIPSEKVYRQLLFDPLPIDSGADTPKSVKEAKGDPLSSSNNRQGKKRRRDDKHSGTDHLKWGKENITPEATLPLSLGGAAIVGSSLASSGVPVSSALVV